MLDSGGGGSVMMIADMGFFYFEGRTIGAVRNNQYLTFSITPAGRHYGSRARLGQRLLELQLLVLGLLELRLLELRLLERRLLLL